MDKFRKVHLSHWEITTEAIRFTGNQERDYELTKVNYNDYLKDQLYDPLLQITKENWASDALIYEFNNAFLYALIFWEKPLDMNAFRASLESQQELLKKRICNSPQTNDNPFLSIH